MIMDKPVIKDIKERLGYLADLNNTTSYRVDCVLKTMQVVNLLARAVQDLANQGL